MNSFREWTSRFVLVTLLGGMVPQIPAAAAPVASFGPFAAANSLSMTSAGSAFQDEVKGPNVSEVTFGAGHSTQGILVQTAEKSWHRLNPDRTFVAEFQESARDEWSVYLASTSGTASIHVNLWTREVTYRSGQTTSKLGTVLSASNKPFAGTSGASSNDKCGPGSVRASDGSCIQLGTVVSSTAGSCPQGERHASDGSCVVAVEFHPQAGLSLAQAQELSARNGWELATASEVQEAWNRLGLDTYAFGLLAEGTFAVPVQTDHPNFKRGANVGASGGNQGFFYVLASTRSAPPSPAAVAPAAGTPAPSSGGTLTTAPVANPFSNPVVKEGDPTPVVGMLCVDWYRGNWMLDSWPVPLTVNSDALLVQAAVTMLERRGSPVNNGTLQELVSAIRSDPVTRYDFAPFMLRVAFDALLAENPTGSQAGFKARFERYQGCANNARARKALAAWNTYQGHGDFGRSGYEPMLLTVFDGGPPSSGFSPSDPFKFGPRGGEAVALLYFPLGASERLLGENPLNQSFAGISEEMNALAASVGVASGTSAAGLLVGSSAAFIAVQGAKVMAAIAGPGVTAAALPTWAQLSFANLFGPAVVAVAAACVLGVTVAEVVKKAQLEERLRKAVQTESFSVREFMNVPDSETQTRRAALFTHLMQMLIGDPAERGDLTLALPFLPGEYTLRLKANGSSLSVSPDDADETVTIRSEPVGDWGRFVVERQRDSSYRIRVKASGKYLRVNSDGFPTINTRTQLDDGYSRFRFQRQGDGSYRLVVQQTGKHVHVDASSQEKWANTQWQPDDDHTRFWIERTDLSP